MIRAKCSVKNCERPVDSFGLCDAHYQRLRRTGDIQPERPIGYKLGMFNPKWKGGQIKYVGGRILIYVPDHPYPNHKGGKHVFRYRLVMEQALGRYLLPTEIIHHKNGDVTDDRLENLQVLTKADHCRVHRNPKTRRFESIKKP